MKITKLELEGVLLLEPQYFEDYRGYYCETYSKRTLEKEGIDTIFVQDNEAFSIKKGTVRGIHFQINPKAQTKLVRCVRGAVLDIVVDLRKKSPTYKKWLSVELSETNRKQLLLPKGYGHAYVTLTDNSEFLYKVDEFYEPAYERIVRWNDPEININWGVEDVIASPKDMKAPLLKDLDINF
ncbi:MAG: dTDP-4-dehydrorhamnose 3,5-epimerase [Elusimicrobiota bacterium]|jgi:dTDP-4-dehydrorhamnose 3,5-epimerase|nr:dTDP-4-dehydrorhamnose 3,5-epimerase [Elusimicrobiota bacterium]